VLVVCRGADEETQAWLVIEKSRARLPLVKVEVTQGGQVAALNAGLDALTGDIVAITDDDAAPRPTWLERIERHFANSPDVGGVGGRDWVRLGAVEMGLDCLRRHLQNLPIDEKIDFEKV